MIRRYLKISLMIIAIAFIMSSCSQNVQEQPVEQKGIQLPVVSKTIYSNLNLPAWLLTPPQGTVAIGVVNDARTRKSRQPINAAKFAAISLSKNIGSFEFDRNEVLTQSAVPKDDGKPYDYKVTLKADTSYPDQVRSLLKPLAEAQAETYKLFLMGTQSQTLNQDLIKANAGSTPKWCREADITEDDEYVYVVGKAVETRLTNAWRDAQDNALDKLAQYRLRNVEQAVQSTPDPADKEALLDKVNLSFNASFAKTWLFHKLENNVSSYNVFIMLKEKK
ncbi:MAG: hypothetical protein R6V77_04295 [Candidatus Cloacimonadaceae bacterium]